MYICRAHASLYCYQYKVPCSVTWARVCPVIEAAPDCDIFNGDSNDSDDERRDFTLLDSDALDEHSERPMCDSEWMITGTRTSNHNSLDGELIQDIRASNDIRSVNGIKRRLIIPFDDKTTCETSHDLMDTCMIHEMFTGKRRTALDAELEDVQ